MRRRSARSARPQRGSSAIRKITGIARPQYTCTVRTISRWPTMTESCPMYKTEPVSITMPNRIALIQWNRRSARLNRGGAVAPVLESGFDPALGGVVVAAIGPAHPSVDVVAVLLPVSGLHFLRQLDAGEPLAALVAVHRRDVEPYRSAVRVRDVGAVELVRDDHVAPSGLAHSEALGVRAVERHEAHRASFGLHDGAVEQVSKQHALPLHVVNPPTGHALEVLRERLRWERGELLVRKGERRLDQAIDAQAVLRLALAGQVAGDRI